VPGKRLQQEQTSRGDASGAFGLTRSGFVAALFTGAIAGMAGVGWVILLLLYFGAATTVSRLGRDTKMRKAGGLLEKSGARDATQVLANGGAFAAGALIFAATGQPIWIAFAAGALAASSADTWATELGLLSHQTPRSILTGKPVQPGVSGGVTLAGTGAGMIGALVVAAAAPLLALEAPPGAPLVGGVAGMVVDSLLGATVQERRWCPACERDTERRVHACGAASDLVGGVRGVRNDLVNSLATLSGGAVSAALLLVSG
jgi:uncharacterized protein (TIGR00297 family)